MTLRNKVGIFFAVLAIAVVAGCASKAELLSKSLAGVNAASSAFVTWDKEHQDQIVDAATSHEQGAAALADYRAKRGKVTLAFVAAYGAIAAASTDVQTTGGLDAAVDALRSLVAALQDLGVIPAVKP